MKDHDQTVQQDFIFACTDTDIHRFRGKEIQSSEERVCVLSQQALEEALPKSQREHEGITDAISGPLFRLCRQIRRIEADQRKELTAEQIQEIYDLYYEEYRSRGSAAGWSSEPSCDVWDSFRTQLKAILCATDEHPVAAAFRLSLAYPETPEAASRYTESPKSKLILQLCYWLNAMNGGKGFFLSCNDVETYARIDRTTASKKLRDLCNTTPPVLKCVQKGYRRKPSGEDKARYESKATQYEYLL